jgi:uncharacterized membrane protein YgdD (TMEM256/DUF423 family)
MILQPAVWVKPLGLDEGVRGVQFFALKRRLYLCGRVFGAVFASSAAGFLWSIEPPVVSSRPMNNVLAMRTAAIMGMLAVGLGAFGAHGLKEILTRNGTAAIWETAVFYHFIHAVMLFVLSGRNPIAVGPWWSFLIGIVIFSGSLYLLALTNQRWLGAITPIGGASFIVGWLWLAAAAGNAAAR